MQLWLISGSEVTVREQLVTQVILGIVSSDLIRGQRLPSTRQLARRFGLHPNTISAAYRQLERDHWVERRHGSGVYIRNLQAEALLSTADPVDRLIVSLFRTARELHVPVTYDQSGRMSAHVMKPGRKSSITDPLAVTSASCDELRQIADGYVGYYGTFTLDERVTL